jgi:hypothetical protein
MSDERTYNSVLLSIAALVVAFAAYLAWSSIRGVSQAPTVAPAVARESSIPERGFQADENKSAPAAAVVSEGIQPVISDPILAEIMRLLMNPHAVPNETLLSFRTKGDLAQFLREAAKYGLKLINTIDPLNTVRVGFETPAGLRDYLASKGANAPGLDANYWFTVPKLPKVDATNQGGVAAVGDKLLTDLNATGDRTEWGKGITVAVLDTGVKAHPTFAEGQVTHVDLVADGSPMHSHGTSVASLIAGTDDRVPGVAPGAHILDIRVANDKGYSVSSVLAQGIVEAVDRGAQIINISMGSYDDSYALRQAVAYAAAQNVFIVAAGGNDGYDQLAYPAAIPQVISVGAVDAQNKQAVFSNSGNDLDFTAYGVALPTAWDTDKMASVSGTSQAAAVASGVIAANLTLRVTAAQLLAQMQKDAKTTGAPRSKVGYGIIQVTGH